jgi:Ca-activated chloride channel family protein
MRFAADIWLWGTFSALVLAAILIIQGLRLARSRARFGDERLVSDLLTARTGLRRAIRGVLSCLAVALVFIAAAQPQYGKGTRILPATNLDVVLVLDYSKSMYARDVSPSRIGRAKIEMGRLVRELSGARFAAVAFAGESISFP